MFAGAEWLAHRWYAAPGGAGVGDPKPRHDHELAGGLRRLVTRLQEAELLVMRRWINEELHLLKTRGRPLLRLVRTPSYSRGEPLPDFDGSFYELAGQVRRLLT